MIFVPKLIKQSRFGRPKFQRGILHPVGFWSSGGGSGTLALTSLASNHSPFSGDATAGVRAQNNGNVAELTFGINWFDQNASTEWIDSFGGGSASDYEVQLDTGSLLGDGVISGPTRGTYRGLGVTRTWTLLCESATNESGTFTSTMRIREIADTSNNVSASVQLTADATGI